jgi:hypothetical protein
VTVPTPPRKVMSMVPPSAGIQRESVMGRRHAR